MRNHLPLLGVECEGWWGTSRRRLVAGARRDAGASHLADVLLDRHDNHVRGFSAGVLGFVRDAAADELHVAASPGRLRRLAVDRERQRRRAERDDHLVELVLASGWFRERRARRSSGRPWRAGLRPAPSVPFRGGTSGSAALPGAAVLNSTSSASTGPCADVRRGVRAGRRVHGGLAGHVAVLGLPSGRANWTLEADSGITIASGC